ncbi:Trafficking protein particle complex subunit [Trichinella spiralis]|uniref:Trafficking protein particle complex subunit n=1 Tax=Trichinella spiralis TaxID=6334 RepID=A0ABR3K3G5_TRISP
MQFRHLETFSFGTNICTAKILIIGDIIKPVARTTVKTDSNLINKILNELKLSWTYLNQRLSILFHLNTCIQTDSISHTLRVEFVHRF